jgi:hypothetical protein
LPIVGYIFGDDVTPTADYFWEYPTFFSVAKPDTVDKIRDYLETKVSEGTE